MAVCFLLGQQALIPPKLHPLVKGPLVRSGSPRIISIWLTISQETEWYRVCNTSRWESWGSSEDPAHRTSPLLQIWTLRLIKTEKYVHVYKWSGLGLYLCLHDSKSHDYFPGNAIPNYCQYTQSGRLCPWFSTVSLNHVSSRWNIVINSLRRCSLRIFCLPSTNLERL